MPELWRGKVGDSERHQGGYGYIGRNSKGRRANDSVGVYGLYQAVRREGSDRARLGEVGVGRARQSEAVNGMLHDQQG